MSYLPQPLGWRRRTLTVEWRPSPRSLRHGALINNYCEAVFCGLRARRRPRRWGQTSGSTLRPVYASNQSSCRAVSHDTVRPELVSNLTVSHGVVRHVATRNWLFA
jgi:hypothetical protein